MDPSNRYLIVLTPRDLPNVPEGEGNAVHVLSVSHDGHLREIPEAFQELPVPLRSNPIGMAVT